MLAAAGRRERATVTAYGNLFCRSGCPPEPGIARLFEGPIGG